ncbi:MAG: hypothetical protein Kow00107_03080 [Planctomycetota bacterium]
MSKKNTDPGPQRIDLTPLIDCIFLLIVFFIVAGKFKKQESRLNAYLPKNIGPVSDMKPNPDKFFIAVICQLDDNSMRWSVNNQEIRTRSELVHKIREISQAGKGKDTVVTIDGEPGVDFYWIMASLDACAEAEMTEVVFCNPRVPVGQWPVPHPKNFKLR